MRAGLLMWYNPLAWLRAIYFAVVAENSKLDQILDLLHKIPVSSDLKLRVGESNMAKRIGKLVPRGVKQAVMPDVQLVTGTPGLELQVVDQNGSPIGNIDPSAVTTSLTSDDAGKLSITAGADSLHYRATVQPNVGGAVVVSATLAFNGGTPGPFNASIKLLMPVPPASTPTDLQILITGNP